jgi:hypothetical protein
MKERAKIMSMRQIWEKKQIFEHLLQCAGKNAAAMSDGIRSGLLVVLDGMAASRSTAGLYHPRPNDAVWYRSVGDAV